MAFSKKLTVRGAEGNYLRLVAYRWDANAREASAHFALFVDRGHSERSKPGTAHREQPLHELVAKVRIYGEAFERYLGTTSLADGAQSAGTDILAHIYAAAKDASIAARKTGKSDPDIHVISDFGSDLFADAKFA